MARKSLNRGKRKTHRRRRGNQTVRHRKIIGGETESDTITFSFTPYGYGDLSQYETYLFRINNEAPRKVLVCGIRNKIVYGEFDTPYATFRKGNYEIDSIDGETIVATRQ